MDKVQETAKKIIDAIKNDISEQKKRNPNMGSYSSTIYLDGENCKMILFASSRVITSILQKG